MVAKTAKWAECPTEHRGCGRERRLTAEGLVVAHNYWHEPSYQMVACKGSGQPPAPAEEMAAA